MLKFGRKCLSTSFLRNILSDAAPPQIPTVEHVSSSPFHRIKHPGLERQIDQEVWDRFRRSGELSNLSIPEATGATAEETRKELVAQLEVPDPDRPGVHILDGHPDSGGVEGALQAAAQSVLHGGGSEHHIALDVPLSPHPSRVVKREATGMERLLSFLIRAGCASAKEARSLIDSGDVFVDGILARSPDESVTPLSRVTIRGSTITLQDPYTRIFCYHKPRGTVCAGSDDAHRLPISHAMIGANSGAMSVLRTGRALHIVNVLPINADGMVVLCNDPAFAQNLIVSRPGMVIRTHTLGWVSEQRLQALRRGVRINGKQYAPIEVERVAEHSNSSTVLDWIVKPTERNRSFVTLLRSLGVKILRMSCTRIGPLVLRGLRPGYLAEVPVPRQWSSLLDERWWPWDPDRTEVATQLRAYWAAARSERDATSFSRSAAYDSMRSPAVRKRRDASLAASLDAIDEGALTDRKRAVAVTRDGLEIVDVPKHKSVHTLSGLTPTREALKASGQNEVVQDGFSDIPRAPLTGYAASKGVAGVHPDRHPSASRGGREGPGTSLQSLKSVADDLASVYGGGAGGVEDGEYEGKDHHTTEERDSYFGRKVPRRAMLGQLDRGALDMPGLEEKRGASARGAGTRAGDIGYDDGSASLEFLSPEERAAMGVGGERGGVSGEGSESLRPGRHAGKRGVRRGSGGQVGRGGDDIDALGVDPVAALSRSVGRRGPDRATHDVREGGDGADASYPRGASMEGSSARYRAVLKERGVIESERYLDFDPATGPVTIRAKDSSSGSAGARGRGAEPSFSEGWSNVSLEDEIVAGAADPSGASLRGLTLAEDEMPEKRSKRRGPPGPMSRRPAQHQTTFGLGVPKPGVALRRRGRDTGVGSPDL